jgi:hypothetical protein
MVDQVLTLQDMRESIGTKTAPVTPTENESRIARLIAADSAKRERERLAKRKELRQQVAQREVLALQMADVSEQLKLLDAKADALAADHGSQTQPIQQALASAVGARRTGLLGKLSEANYALEQGLAVVERCRGPLVKQHQRVRSEVAGLPTEGALSGGGLASPSLSCEMFAGEKRRAVAQARVELSREQLAQLEPMLAAAKTALVPRTAHGWTEERGKRGIDFETVSLLGHRIRKWKCELTHASAEQHEAVAEIERLTRDLIAE